MEQDLKLEYFKEHRNFVNSEIKSFLTRLKFPNARVLEIGPSPSLKIKEFIPECKYLCADIVKREDIDFQIDLTIPNSINIEDQFDIIVCAEVLEHVVEPFQAVQSILIF